MAPPHPDWLTPVADEVEALEEVVLEDWAVARLATARMRAVVYCMLVCWCGCGFTWLWLWVVCNNP